MKTLLLFISILSLFFISCSADLSEARFDIEIVEEDNRSVLTFILSENYNVFDFNWIAKMKDGDEIIIEGRINEVTLYCNGSYSIQMINAHNGEVIDSKELDVNIIPTAAHYPRPFLYGPKYLFSALGNNPCFNYEWDIDYNGTIDYTDRNTIHRFDKEETNVSSLRVITNDGEEAKAINVISVIKRTDIVEYYGELSCVDDADILQCFNLNNSPLRISAYFDTSPKSDNSVRCLVEEISSQYVPIPGSPWLSFNYRDNDFVLDYQLEGDTLIFDQIINTFYDWDCKLCLDGYLVLNSDRSILSGPMLLSGENDGLETGTTSCIWTMNKAN